MQNILRIIVIVAFFMLRDASASKCPEPCTCQDAEMSCRNAAMTSVPHNLNNGEILVLDLSDNNISIIGNSDFDNIQQVEIVLLSDNNVEVIEPEVFSRLYELRQLDLHSNSIESFHPSVFQNNPNLTILDLSDNKIQNLNIDLNSNFDLKYLNLSRNSLQDVTTFLPIITLETLDLSYNQLETLGDEAFSGMVQLTYLDLTGNSDLDYGCNLRTLWKFCLKQDINCTTDDMQSWRMLENLECEVEPQAMSLTDGYLEVNESVSEEAVFDGSGDAGLTEATDASLDSDVDGIPSAANDTDILSTEPEPEVTSSDNWMLIAIVASSLCCVLIIIIVAVICVFRCRNRRQRSVGELSHAESFDYLNQSYEFNKNYKNNSRKENNRSRNHYDRVLPPGYGRDVLQLQVSDNVTAEVVRVPSFKARGIAAKEKIATPLHLPEEVMPQGTGLVIQNKGVHNSETELRDYPLGSLSRSSQSSYEGNNTIRAGSIKKYVKPEDVSKPNSHYAVSEIRRIPSSKRS